MQENKTGRHCQSVLPYRRHKYIAVNGRVIFPFGQIKFRDVMVAGVCSLLKGFLASKNFQNY
jgi:hypothetical protein